MNLYNQEEVERINKVKETNDYQIYSRCINYYNLGDFTISNIF